MMNYVGSISILDRGEIHAQAIIDKNARSLAQRIADETKDELDKVMTRVENIYVSYEQSTQDMFSSHSANVEYIEDIKELEEILTDQIKKKKYQQQVTVFIVGFENLSNQRLKLIQQVNEFFMDATRPPDEEEPQAPSPDIDLEEVSQSIEDSLNSAEELADRLGELNKEMVDWLTNYAINKASSKGKKKLEKALGQAKDDLSALGDKLLKVQGEMEEKEEKVQQMVKQLEIKTQDVQKFRTAAEVAKKSLQDLEDSNNKAQAEVKVKDQILKDLRSKVQMLELEVGQSQYVSKMSSERMVEGKLELQSEEDLQKRMEDLQMQVDSNKSQMLEAQREWQKLHDQQVLALTTSHKQELEDLKAAFEEQMKGSKGSSAHSKRQDADLSDDVQSHEHLNTKLKESRPSTKSSKQSTPAQKQRSGSVQSKAGTKSIVINQSPSKIQKETSDASVQDEGGDPISAHVETRQSKRARSTLETVQEADVNFDNIFDIKDHQAWSTVPADQIPGRFVQYRKLTQSTLDEMEEKLHITITKTQRKVQTLKTQFQDHKSKWEAERKLLIEQVEQAQKLQNEAEKEADNAMTQLEEFINEQERLEEEEEEKRNDISKGISRPVTVRSSSEKKSQPSAPTEVKVVSPEPVGAEGSEQELKHLMQQTDDAKAQEMARLTSGAMSAPPAVEPEAEVKEKEIRKTQTEPELNKEATVTEEDVRMMSAASRASLRSQYKSRLEETRQAVEDRRSKSPAISVPSQRSLEEDQLVEEDDDDIPMPDEVRGQDEETDEVAEIGTSPPPPMRVETTEHVSSMSRKSGTTLVDHPVVKEYLKAYEGVQSFRDTLSKILLDKEMLQAGDIIQDLDMMKFDREGKVQLQLENMTKNVYYVLEEIVSVLGSIMIEEREPIVSSLTGMLASRDGTKNTLAGREKSADSGRGRTGTRASNQSFSGHMQLASASSEKLALKDLQAQYESLQGQLTEEARKHEEQLRHNTVVMMEMQDTINELQRELTALGRASSRMRPTSEAGSQQPESAVMFTRLDSERNAKIMKRAVNDRKLDTEKYKEAVSKMDDYVSLPAQRLCHLVRKYVHHCQMKEIEENVKKSKSLNENVFEILDKMEGLQNQRAKRWANKMDEMGSERMRLANLLMETLDSIEQESGIFLIKPMYSYRGREMKERYGGKLSRPLKPQRNLSPMREVSSYAPAPTPASNARGIARVQAFSQSHDPNHHQSQSRKDPVRPLEGDETGLMGSQALAYAGTSQRQTWNLNASQVRGETVEQHLNLMNTPRILELDINRMLIGQNTISTKLPSSGLSEDRLVNASQNNLRSYVTVNRPSAQPGLGQRPRSFTGIKDAPPSSPIPRSMATNSAGNKRVRMSDMDQSRALLTGTPPLPPISGRGRDSPGEEDGQEQTRSPPGSSMRMSPPHIQEIISPLK